MTQRELNELYEYVDIELAYKYSYIFKTLLMTFFYLPLFPLGIIFSMCGLILAFYFTEIKQKKNMSKGTFIFIYIYTSVLFSFISYVTFYNISCRTPLPWRPRTASPAPPSG